VTLVLAGITLVSTLVLVLWFQERAADGDLSFGWALFTCILGSVLTALVLVFV
jgi:hypothetical protein